MSIMGESGWPRPPTGSIDRKKRDQLISLAKTQWTVFLGIQVKSPVEKSKVKGRFGCMSGPGSRRDWVVLNMTNSEVVFRSEAKKIIDMGRTAIIRIANNDGCVLRHVYDKPGACDVCFDFPEARDAMFGYYDHQKGETIIQQIPGGYILCTLLKVDNSMEDETLLIGWIAIWSVRSAKVIGHISMTAQPENVYYPHYFAPGKILIKPLSSSPCPEIWRIEPRLEFEAPLVKDIANIKTSIIKKLASYYPSKNGHLALTHLRDVEVIKSGDREPSLTLEHHYPCVELHRLVRSSWLGSKHLAVRYNPPCVGPGRTRGEEKDKLIDIETKEEKIIPGKYFKLPGHSDSFAIVKNNVVEVWQLNDFLSAGATSSGPIHVLKHPPGVKIEKYNGFALSNIGLDMVTFASDDIFRLWRKGQLIREYHYPIWRSQWENEIDSVSILDPDIGWVEALGQWLLCSLHGRESVFLDLGIISIILTCLV